MAGRRKLPDGVLSMKRMFWCMHSGCGKCVKRSIVGNCLCWVCLRCGHKYRKHPKLYKGYH
jgi:hypothetical protein